MCTSHATFFYGVWVNFASLNFAATAHQQTRAPLLAVDLILQRRRAGVLQCGGQQDDNKSVADLPEEIWSLVKLELLGAEVRTAEWKTLAKFRCEECDEKERSKSGSRQDRKITRSWSRWTKRPSCDYCYENLFESDYLTERSADQSELVDDLLLAYGLELPFSQFWSDQIETQYWDPHALSAIALPRRSSSDPSSTSEPQNSAECHHHYGSGTGVVNFSPEALVVSPADQLKFRRLITDYHLEVVDRTGNTILAPSQAADLSEENWKSSEDGKAIEEGPGTTTTTDEARSKKLHKKDEPRWMLWTSCDPCC